MEKKEDSKRCDELVEKKRKTRDEKGISELSGSKVSPLRSCSSSSSSLRLSDMVRPLSCCSNSVDEKRKRSPLLSSENVKVFASFITRGAMQSAVHCYRIDPNKSTNSEIMAHVSPICSIPSPVIPRCFGSAALGSKIYMMGGVYGGDAGSADFDGSRDIFSFDTASINNDQDSLLEHPPWRKEDTQLLAKRYGPTVIATHGKIYVLGSLFDPQPWGEVFDPVSSTCLPLADPPFDQTSGFEVVPNGNKIFFCGIKALYCFNIKSNSWTEVSTLSSLRCPRLLYRSVVVDDIVFTFINGDVLAYDFATENWFERPVEGLGIPDADGHLVHIGNGILSVLWPWYHDDDPKGEKVSIQCLTFRVYRVTNAEKGSFLVADILAQSAYYITSGDSFYSCFAI